MAAVNSFKGDPSIRKSNMIFAEYVWIGGTSPCDLRSKTRVLKMGQAPPIWNYDGSSTEQAKGEDSEVLINPVRIYPDPFRRDGDLLVLCETLKHDSPLADNMRPRCEEILNQCADEEPMFGLEQEYFVIDNSTGKAVGWPAGEMFVPRGQGGYYCGVDGRNVNADLRKFYDMSLNKLRDAGIPITGGNFEVAPGQLEVQVCDIGIALCDHLWMTRYILQRTAQEFNYGIEFMPKPYFGDWNGSGCHANFSTKSMREDGGFEVIMNAIKNLEANHAKHISCYGAGNKDRLTGKHETASWSKFSYGVGDRGASIRIPVETNAEQKGYLEDRRPSSAMNPYVVCGMLAQTSMGICPDIEFPTDL